MAFPAQPEQSDLALLLGLMGSSNPANCVDCGQALPAESQDPVCPGCILRKVLAEPPVDSQHSESFPSPGRGLFRFGDYQLLKEIAHGGVGVVWRALDLRLNRVVALKMPLLGPFTSGTATERFRREAQAIAALQHPGIVPIYDFGQIDGQAYLTMELVEGQDLAARLRHGALPPRVAARYLLGVATAMGHAHQRGILHRDLKPANILVDRLDQPRVTDFGLALRMDEANGLTMTGEVVGSPNYLAPERAAGDGRDIGPAADVFSLGAILYECLTGRPPFLAPNLAEILLRIRESGPASPRYLNPAVPRDLETICLKCLEKEPKRRYASATDLAEDLDRFLRVQPVHARPVGPIARLWRWGRRRPAMASLAVAFLLTLFIGFAGILWQWRRAVSRERELSRLLYAADMQTAQKALAEHDYGVVRSLLDAHRPRGNEEDLRGIEWRFLLQDSLGDNPVTLGCHELNAMAVAFSPNGKTLASAGMDGLRLWDVSAVRERGSQVHSRERIPISRCAVAFSPTGESVATSGADSAIRLWNPESLVATDTFVHDDQVAALAYSPDGAVLATITFDATWQGAAGPAALNLWDLKARRRAWRHPIQGAWSLAFSPDNRTLAVGTDGGEILLWDRSRGAARERIRTDRTHVAALDFSSDGMRIAASAGRHVGEIAVFVFEVATCREVSRFSGHATWVPSVRFSPDGSLVASAGTDQTIRLTDPANGTEVAALRGHLSEVWGVDFSPDGTILGSCGKDGQVKLWTLPLRTRPNPSCPLPRDTSFALLSPHGEHLLTLHSNQFVSVWNTTRREVVASAPLPISNAVSAAVSPDGTLLAFGADSGAITTWRFQADSLVSMGGAQAHTGPVSALAFAPDGSLLASGGSDAAIRLWLAGQATPIGEFRTQSSAIQFLRISRNCRRVASAHANWTAEVWDRDRQRRTALLKGHKDALSDLALSRSGDLVVTSSLDATAKLWDLRAGREVQTLSGSGYAVVFVALSPDGRRLAISGADGHIGLWDTGLGRSLGEYFGGVRKKAGPVAFLPDGDSLICLRHYESFDIWRAPPLTRAVGKR